MDNYEPDYVVYAERPDLAPKPLEAGEPWAGLSEADKLRYQEMVAAGEEEQGPGAYRRNLPSMAPAAPPAGGAGDTTATGGKNRRAVRADRRLPAWRQDPDRPLADNVGGAE